MIEKTISKLMMICGLGEIVGEIRPVSGGLMHRMYRVMTAQGCYAVKHLNPEIMKRPDAQENYARAEKIERMLEKTDIPIVPAMTFEGKKMLSVDGGYFYVFRWQEGHITDWGNISAEQCFRAGNILGRLHAIEPKYAAREAVVLSEIDWHGYVEKARETEAELAALLEENEELLYAAQQELNRAREALPPVVCISDEDMDPKNIMWEHGEPKVIDLECLDYGNPVSHVMQLALQWAGIVNCELDTDKMVAFFDGYLEAYDNCFRNYADVTGVAYTWVEWLEYNIQRALGSSMDEAERKLGAGEVRNTIGRIAYIHQAEPQIREALEERLKKVDAHRYDNHDERICYYELLLRRELDGIRQYPLPQGYRFVPYEDGDRESWIAIELSAKEFADHKQGMEAWERYFGACQELSQRMFYIENEQGEKVATATALYDIHGRDTSGDGWLHWVAVKRDYQGKGLSKPLLTYVLNRMKDLGYTHAKIPTQTTTWLACKIYLELGFCPVSENLEHSRAGWRIIREMMSGN